MSRERTDHERTKDREYVAMRRATDPEYVRKQRERQRVQRVADRLAALRHYGGDPPKCACCGEGTVEFLCIDHIEGGGNEHRRAVKQYQVGAWLRRNGYPPGFQVLCHNCNYAKTVYGVCPHQVSALAVLGDPL